MVKYPGNSKKNFEKLIIYRNYKGIASLCKDYDLLIIIILKDNMNTFAKNKNLTTILASIFRIKHYNASVSYETQMNTYTNYLYIYINIYSYYYHHQKVTCLGFITNFLLLDHYFLVVYIFNENISKMYHFSGWEFWDKNISYNLKIRQK